MKTQRILLELLMYIKNFNAYCRGVNCFNQLKDIELPPFVDFKPGIGKSPESPYLKQNLSNSKDLKIATLDLKPLNNPVLRLLISGIWCFFIASDIFDKFLSGFHIKRRRVSYSLPLSG